jgi:propionyl-CoA synthetase
MTDYTSLYAGWQTAPDAYWAGCARLIDWDKAPEKIFDAAQGPYGAWFPDAALNTSYNCLDRHVRAGHGERTAIIWDSPMEGRQLKLTYAQTLERVAKFAGGLTSLGVIKGDRVVIYMPMVPEAAIAMLACARIGAIHSMVFGGFAPPELATRIADAKPKAIIAASCGLEPGRIIAYKPMLDAALALCDHKPSACVIFQRPACPAAMIPGLDHDFIALEQASSPHKPVSVAATHPLYILYTSGTTGKPKGVVRDNGGHAVALAQSMKTTYGVGAGEVMWAAADVGWAVGHSYVVYGPLLVGATTIIYEGKPVGTPDPGAFWRVIAEHKAKVLFTAPTALRAVKQQDFEGEYLKKYDLSCMRALFLAGERCDPPTATWIQQLLDKPVIDNWWQTETGWPITARFLGLGLTPFKPGSGGRPSPGYDVQTLDEAGEILPRGTVGNLCIRLPMPPGCGPTLWHNDDGYRSAYLSAFPGWYRTGDAGMVDADGDVWVMGRTDDIINVAGHRLSTGAMEEVLAMHGDVAECAVIARADALKGEIPYGLVVLKAGVARNPKEIETELIALVREKIGPVAAFRDVMVVPRLPKTRSGKILRATMRKIANGEPVTIPSTIEDPAVIDQIAAAFAAPV